MYFSTEVPSSFGHSFQTPIEITIPLVDKGMVYQGNTMKIVLPESPLAEGSVKIIPLSGVQNFSDWQDFENAEAYQLIQRVVQVWETKGITDYLVYGKQSNDSTFDWEVVPYPKEGCRLWKQFKVLWNITFGGSPLSQIERDRVIKIFKDTNAFSESEIQRIEAIENIALKDDAFCNPKVIDKQLVFEGRNINVLYNYAPIENKQHYLLTTKEHRSRFSELTDAEYLETMQLSQRLVEKHDGCTAYLFHKTGIEAGQTVLHWHEHLVFTATKTQDLIGKLIVLKNMLFGSSPLPEVELKSDVESLRLDMQEVLK